MGFIKRWRNKNKATAPLKAVQPRVQKNQPENHVVRGDPYLNASIIYPASIHSDWGNNDQSHSNDSDGSSDHSSGSDYSGTDSSSSGSDYSGGGSDFSSDSGGGGSSDF